MTTKENNKIYRECQNITRTKLETRVTEEIAKEIGSNYRTLPEFEQGLFDHVFIKHNSLQRNELLKCRWKKYKQNIEKRVFAPFQFPNIRHLHFYKGSIRFQPSESIYQYPEYRMKLRPGPGVDSRGQLPIPQELMMKRSTATNKDVSKLPQKKKRNEKKN